MFSIKKNKVEKTYTGKNDKPVLRCSICTGEQVAGFKDESGHFTEVMLIQNDRDLDEFMELYNVSVITKEY